MPFSSGVSNFGGAPGIAEGLLASRPAAGLTGRLYIGTDSKVLYRDTGSAWDTIGTDTSGFVVKNGQAGPLTIGTTDATTFKIITGGADRLTITGAGVTTFASGITIGGTLQMPTGSTTSVRWASNAGLYWDTNGTQRFMSTDNRPMFYVHTNDGIATQRPGVNNTLSDYWKLGQVKAGAVALDAANYVEVSINGVIVKLLKAS